MGQLCLWNDFNDRAATQWRQDPKRVHMAKISLIVNGNPVTGNIDPRTHVCLGTVT